MIYLDEFKEEDASANFAPNTSENPEPLVKKPEPTFIVEILPEDDTEKKIRNTNSARKFKLFDSQSRYKTNADEILVKDQSNNFNETLHESFGESNTPTISLCENDSFRFVCRRIKSRSKHGSAPKRFKLI